jgi:origin recognition complex subunit 4
MSTRKRARSSLPADLDEDELSPTKNTAKKDTSKSNKKRKLNAYGSSPALAKSTPQKPPTLIEKARGLFGFKNGRENMQPNEEDDELNRDTGVEEKESREPDIWEVPEELPAVVKKRPGSRKKINGHTRPGHAKAATDEVTSEPDISDVEENSGIFIERRSKGVEAAEREELPKSYSSKQIKGNAEVGETTPKRGRGRPRKSGETTTETASVERKAVDPITQSIQPTAKRRGRPRKSDILKKDKALSREALRNKLSRQADDEEAGEPAMLAGRRSGRGTRSGIDDTQSEEAISSNAGGRNKLRNLGSVFEAAVPKGILTPTKRKEKRSRKSVAFSKELDLGFRDLLSATKKRLPDGEDDFLSDEDDEIEEDLPESKTPLKKKVEALLHEQDDSTDESVDDAACAICSGLDSEKPNQILFCDGCDFAVHQKCYGVSVVPKGDWFCKDCHNQELDPVLEEHIAVKLPSIDGFEDHLRIMQKVLLDRLTGQARMKLHGHDAERQKVYQVVEQTVLAGEGNSMLVIGTRGCGKTTVSSHTL